MSENKKLVMSDLTEEQQNDAKICELEVRCEMCSCKIQKNDCICNHIIDSYGNVE